MNIKDMPYKEYYYNFEIDCIKQAFPIIDSLKYSINEYQNINLQDKEQIKTYAKDFKEVSNRLITREGITDYTDYENSIKTLAIINAKIQAIIYIYNLQNNNTFLNSRKIKLYSNKFYKLLKYINSNKH